MTSPNLTDSEKLDFLMNAVSDIRLRQVALEERHSTREQLVRERLYDTRPLWQAVLQQLEQINRGGHRELRERFAILEAA